MKIQKYLNFLKIWSLFGFLKLLMAKFGLFYILGPGKPGDCKIAIIEYWKEGKYQKKVNSLCNGNKFV
jgi:hypothetical protein